MTLAQKPFVGDPLQGAPRNRDALFLPLLEPGEVLLCSDREWRISTAGKSCLQMIPLGIGLLWLCTMPQTGVLLGLLGLIPLAVGILLICRTQSQRHKDAYAVTNRRVLLYRDGVMQTFPMAQISAVVPYVRHRAKGGRMPAYVQLELRTPSGTPAQRCTLEGMKDTERLAALIQQQLPG